MAVLFNVPILFLVFRRPDITMRVFNEIKNIRPKELFVGCDGPRDTVPEETKKVENVRKIFKNEVDWPCEAKIFFRKKNVGSRVAETEAIDWFFNNVNEGIILEDDCLPHQSFFYFCEELLEYYRNNERIMMISGNNFHFGRKYGRYSYFFSRHVLTWGWATWKRAWRYNDMNLRNFPDFKAEQKMKDIYGNYFWKRNYLTNLNKVYNNKLDAWDFPWSYTTFCQNGLVCIPNVNLVSNIGFGVDAVNHTGKPAKIQNIPLEEISFPLSHPQFLIPSKHADDFLLRNAYGFRLDKQIIGYFIVLAIKILKFFKIYAAIKRYIFH